MWKFLSAVITHMVDKDDNEYFVIGEKQPNIFRRHELKCEQQTRNYITLFIEFSVIADILQNTQ